MEIKLRNDVFVLFSSYFLWSISHPGKIGSPNYDQSGENQAKVSFSDGLTISQVKLEQIITKVFNHYEFLLSISETIRNALKCKLYRIGQMLHKCGGTKQQQLLEKWKNGDASVWHLQVNVEETKLLARA